VRIVYLGSEDYARLTGGFVYNSRLVAALAGQGAGLTEIIVPVAFPSIDGAGRKRLVAAFADMPAEAVLLSDHLHIADIEPLLRDRRFQVVSVFHHSKTIEDRLNGRLADREAELRGFDVCDAVIATSAATRDYLLTHYPIAPERIFVAIPGHERATRSAGPATGARRILTVGAVIPRKRHDYLVEVAAGLRAAGWRWRFVGDLERDPAYVASLRKRIVEAGLSGMVELTGAVGDAELERLWAESALHVAASHYEGYGMAVAEALRHGVPVVTTESGAVGTWARAGVLIAPSGDVAAFARIVDALFSDPERLQRLCHEAWSFGASLPTWDETFAGMAARLGDALLADPVLRAIA
jgi:glycosyltransferase involved in cell wall biosynthesis